MPKRLIQDNWNPAEKIEPGSRRTMMSAVHSNAYGREYGRPSSRAASPRNAKNAARNTSGVGPAMITHAASAAVTQKKVMRRGRKKRKNPKRTNVKSVIL